MINFERLYYSNTKLCLHSPEIDSFLQVLGVDLDLIRLLHWFIGKSSIFSLYLASLSIVVVLDITGVVKLIAIFVQRPH